MWTEEIFKFFLFNQLKLVFIVVVISKSKFFVFQPLTKNEFTFIFPRILPYL